MSFKYNQLGGGVIVGPTGPTGPMGPPGPAGTGAAGPTGSLPSLVTTLFFDGGDAASTDIPLEVDITGGAAQ